MFARMAKDATTLSELMTNREKITMDALIIKYPNGVTVTGFDVLNSTDANGETDSYPIFVFAEDTTKFCNGGAVLNKIVNVWLAHFDGDITACNKALESYNGVKLKFSKSTTKNGRPITLVDVID